MMKTPVLLLISRAINLSVLNHSPRFSGYHFFSLAALDYLEDDQVWHKAQTLRKALHREIDQVGVQYLLAHLGLAFDRYPVEFLTALLEVRTLHPWLKIGLDKGLRYAIRYLKLSGVSRPEVNSLAARLVRQSSAFDSDEETQSLAACLR